jgi:hypothetical protein
MKELEYTTCKRNVIKTKKVMHREQKVAGKRKSGVGKVQRDREFMTQLIKGKS